MKSALMLGVNPNNKKEKNDLEDIIFKKNILTNKIKKYII